MQEILWRTNICWIGVLLTKNVKELPQKRGFRGSKDDDRLPGMRRSERHRFLKRFAISVLYSLR